MLCAFACGGQDIDDEFLDRCFFLWGSELKQKKQISLMGHAHWEKCPLTGGTGPKKSWEGTKQNSPFTS
jgi:hypothetical protein